MMDVRLTKEIKEAVFAYLLMMSNEFIRYFSFLCIIKYI